MDSLRSQTVEFAKIIVVDNGGTDGSTGMLQSEYPEVEVCRLADNTGAAGGFNIATRLAVAAGAEHVWLMDDDVIPEPRALEHLLAGAESLREQGCEPPFMLSLARAPNGMLTNVPDIDRSSNALQYSNWPLQLERGLAPVRRATFVSILFPRRTFTTHGYPLGSMFIWGEDSEFTWRVSKDQPGYLVGRSEVTHVRAQPGMLDIRHEPPGARLPWYRYLVRNTIYNLRIHQPHRLVAQYTRGIIHSAVGLAMKGEFRKVGILMRGVVEGFLFKPDETLFSGNFETASIDFMSESLRERITSESARRIVDMPERTAASIAGHLAKTLQFGG